MSFVKKKKRKKNFKSDFSQKQCDFSVMVCSSLSLLGKKCSAKDKGPVRAKGSVEDGAMGKYLQQPFTC